MAQEYLFSVPPPLDSARMTETPSQLAVVAVTLV